MASGKPGPHAYVALLGMRTHGTERLLRSVEKAFAYRTVEPLQRGQGPPLETVSQVTGIPPRTLSRRKERGHLEPDESDRLLRLSVVFAKALELFEDDRDAARAWLSTPRPGLGGAVP